ncbi:MAG: short-chain dehydrogenase/reductase [Glaciihabitans sp.]|nr:short-chain dehydrogenase/reductase [Glaciihabitans sp.]
MTQGTAIIVGAGPGLGFALARSFAAAGHSIALLARNADKLDTLATELRNDSIDARGYAADASDPASLRAALTKAIDELGAPEALIYNAALLRQDTPTDGDDAGWVNALAVGVLGAKVAAETVLPALAGGRGSLLFTGGGLALAPSPEFASLSVAKAAIRAYATTLFNQHKGTDVHATSVTIAGNIGGGEDRFAPDALAALYLGLHQQPATEWSDELLVK